VQTYLTGAIFAFLTLLKEPYIVRELPRRSKVRAAISTAKQGSGSMSDDGKWRGVKARSAVIVLLAIATLQLSPLGVQLEENMGLPLLFGWRGERPQPSSVAVVALDEDSSAALALPDLDQLDRWPRTIYTRLIRTLIAKGVAAIVMDVALLEPRDADEDASLAQTMRDAGNVVILKMLDRRTVNAQSAAEWELQPLALFGDAAAAVGAFTLPDQSVKKYTTLFPRTPDGVEAALPMIALQLYYRDARAALPVVLRKMGSKQLAELLEAEHSEALFAAKVRVALIDAPMLARQVEVAAPKWFDSNTVQHLHVLLKAYRTHDPVYLNFYGPQRALTTVSLGDVLLNSDSEAVKALAGRVVFLGLSERFHKQRDYFFTSYSSDRDSRISGVEIGATLFANLQQNAVLRSISSWQQTLLLFIWGGLLALATHRLAPSFWLLLMLSTAAGYVLLAAKLFALHDLWLPVFIPLAVAMPTITLLALWHYYRYSLAAEREATAVLSLYVPADIAASAGENRQQLLSEYRQIDAVCLLTDIIGFTTLSEQRAPAYMHELMNRYYREIVDEVERHGGVVANIVGDGLLALWPIPEHQTEIDEPAVQACRAALAIVAASDHMSTTLGESLETCVGIHCGAVSLGNLGAGQHLEYAPVGDTINTTSRVEAYNRQLRTRILLTEPVHQWLQRYLPIPFLLRDHGSAMLKGKRDSLGLYELIESRGTE